MPLKKPELIKNLTKTLLSKNWYKLYKYDFDIRGKNGQWQRHSRESYDRGNGAAIFLYDPARGKVILTRQFRLPTYVNGNESGLLIEVVRGCSTEIILKTASAKKRRRKSATASPK